MFRSNYEKLFTQFMNVFMNNSGWPYSWHLQGKTTGAQLMLRSWIGMVFKRSRQHRKLLLNRYMIASGNGGINPQKRCFSLNRLSCIPTIPAAEDTTQRKPTARCATLQKCPETRTNS